MKETTLEDYLATYGPLLAQYAAQAAAPLHVPSKHPLIDTSSLKRPLLPAQEHVVTALCRAWKRQCGVILSGECGCIAGESMIYDPVADCYRIVKEIESPFHVLAKHGDSVVTARAETPFIKGRRALYRVELSDGSDFVATGNHRVLATSGWTFVSELSSGEPLPGFSPSLPLSSLDTSQVGCPQGGGRSFRTPRDLPDRCWLGHRQCDEQPPLAVGVDQAHALPLGDVLQRNPPLLNADVLAARSSRSLLRFFDPPSISRSSVQRWLDCASSRNVFSESCIRSVFSDPVFHRSHDSIDHLCTTESCPELASLREAFGIPFTTGRLNGNCVYITRISRLRTDWYYDFTVPFFHNYWMAGVFHHNTGKTCISIAAAHYHGHEHYRSLVFCPPHLPEKWEREIRATLPKCSVKHIRNYRDLTAIDRKIKPVGPEWYIVTNTMAKLGSSWEAAAVHYRTDKNDLMAMVAECDLYRCPDCHARIEAPDPSSGIELPVPFEKLQNRRQECPQCHAPLWQWTHSLDRWPVATYIHKRLKHWLDFAIIDESHQASAEDTLVGGAFGSLCAAAKRVLCLTGTLMDGRAVELKPVLFRLAPESLVDEGITWRSDTLFNERYGRIDTTVVTTEKKNNSRYGYDCTYGKGSSTTRTSKRVQPGVMPGLFGKHLMQNIVFVSLEDVSDDLPDLNEAVVPVPMDEELESNYLMVEEALRSAVKEMLARKDRRLLGQMLHVLLGYTDHPYGWGEIGYYDVDERAGTRQFVHVVTPPDLDPLRIRPKEQAILDAVLEEKEEGRKCWIYCQMTEKRDVIARLERILTDAGLNVAVMRASVPTRKREAWIAQHAPAADALICFPKLVETGVDFFDGARTYNVPTILFYQTGYSGKTLRQAGSRHMRIGQWQDCRTRFFFYEETMQARALKLMGDKIQAAESIEGKFSSTGLVAMAGDEGSMELMLARSLVAKLGEDTDVGRCWQKLGTRKTNGTKVDFGRKLNKIEEDLMAALARGPVKQKMLF